MPGVDMRLVAARAALVGGEVIRAAGLRGRGAEVKGAGAGAGSGSGSGDYVTEVDRESERAIMAFLGSSTGVPVVGEETGGGSDRAAERYWLVDPLDGTTNFVHGFLAVGVSVALIEGGRPVAGAVHAPFLGETWSAARGEGTWVTREGGGAERLAVSERPLERAVVGTGFPFRRKEELLGRYMEAFRAGLERFEDLRRPGAAALDLAWVASGVFDGFFELGLAAWDVAAGGLLIEEAGGVVTDWAGGDGWLGGDILAGPPAVHAELLRIARGAGRAAGRTSTRTAGRTSTH